MFRMSLRELMAFFLIVAIALTTLKFASAVWQVLMITLAMFVLFAAVIVALVDRGERQAFAIGFAVVLICYGVLISFAGANFTNSNGANVEFDPWGGRLPTTWMLRYIHRAIGSDYWVDSTGKVIPNYDPSTAGPTTVAVVGGFGTLSANFVEDPPRENYMPIGHLWCALLLGYAGGWFAKWVYVRREADKSR
jgi:hypothetical protein